MEEVVNKNIFVILGPARSGTSAITRALKVLGIDLGNHLTRASKTVNPKGFWEDNEIVYKINRNIFHQLNCLSSGVALLDEEIFNDNKLHSLKKSAIELVKQRFNTTNAWGFKDPQTTRLLPFWKEVFASLHLNENYIIALRNPLSSAQSYQNLSAADIETGLLLWLMHIVPAIQETMGKKRVVVSYERLMENPGEQLERLQTKLGITQPINNHDRDQYIHEFLDKNLYRNQFSDENLKSHPAVQLFPLCLQTYDLLLRISRDEIDFADTEFLHEWQTIWNAVKNNQHFYRYIDSLLKKNFEVKNELRAIHRSRLWKMIYPLRIIQNGVHAFRHRR